MTEPAAPSCPVCSAPMVRRRAASGRWAGQDFWGCSRYATTECPGRIHIGSVSANGEPGGAAQAEFERRRQAYRLRLRAGLPLITCLAVLCMAMAYFALLPISSWAGAVASVVVGFAFLVFIVRLPPDALFWEKGARGERRTADALEPLGDAGFVLLHDRLMPEGRGNIDHIAIGPTGVWVIETKNLKGSVEVVQNKLYVGDHLRQKMVEQVYREAFTTQVALTDVLTPLKATVTPVLCIHGARMPWFDHAVAGVRLVSGGQLKRLLSDGSTVLDQEQVQRLAAAADRRLRAPLTWERGDTAG